MRHLEGKTALVTGGSRGIGRGIALRLAKGGAKVVVNYASNDAAANEAAELIKKEGGEAILYKADIADMESVKAMMEAVNKEHGGIDILVNNAGLYLDKPFCDVTDAELDRLFACNINGVFNCVKFAAKGMIKKRYGKIINITSASAMLADPGLGAYSATKGAVLSMTRSMAKEFGSRNIRVNCVAPGIIKTDMTGIYSQDVLEYSLRRASVKRLGTPEDIAEAVYFLAIPESDYITGRSSM